MAQFNIETVSKSFPFPKLDGDETYTVDLNQLPANVVEYLVWYGARQAVADRCSGIKRSDYKTDEAFSEAIHECVTKTLRALADGSVRMGGGGGGARLSPVEQVCRDLFVDLMTQRGMKVGEAKKAASEWRAVIRDRIIDKARTTGGDEAEAAKNAETVIANITAKAEQLVKQRGKLDIDF